MANDIDDDIEKGWCLIDSQSDTVLVIKSTREAIIKEQDKQKYGQVITHIGYGYEDEDEEGMFVELEAPAEELKKTLKP